MKNKVYKTIQSLSDAFNSGELDKSKFFLMLDKSGNAVSLSMSYDNDLTDIQNEKAEAEAPKSKIEYATPLEQALTILGIPWKWS